MRRTAPADLLGARAAVVTAAPSGRDARVETSQARSKNRGGADRPSGAGRLVRARARRRGRRGLASASAFTGFTTLPPFPTLTAFPTLTTFTPVAVAAISTVSASALSAVTV